MKIHSIQLTFKANTLNEDNYRNVTGLPVRNIRYIGNNSYRGATLVGKPKCLSVLKDAGVKRVIDLNGPTIYEKEVKQAGLDYFLFDMTHNRDGYNGNFWSKDGVLSRQEYENRIRTIFSPEDFDNYEEVIKSRINDYDRQSRNVIDNLVGFIRRMQEGHCYICDEYGTHTTDDALLLNNIFNPQKGTTHGICDLDEIDCLKNLYARLNENDKKQMCWTKDFDAGFLTKLGIKEKELLKKLKEFI